MPTDDCERIAFKKNITTIDRSLEIYVWIEQDESLIAARWRINSNVETEAIGRWHGRNY